MAPREASSNEKLHQQILKLYLGKYFHQFHWKYDKTAIAEGAGLSYITVVSRISKQRISIYCDIDTAPPFWVYFQAYRTVAHIPLMDPDGPAKAQHIIGRLLREIQDND